MNVRRTNKRAVIVRATIDAKVNVITSITPDLDRALAALCRERAHALRAAEGTDHGPQGPGFYVMAECCDQCLYGKRAIVDGRRRGEIQRSLARHDNHFICHKASIAGKEVACRGDYNARGCGQLGRIMARLDLVRFIKEEDLPLLVDRGLRR